MEIKLNQYSKENRGNDIIMSVNNTIMLCKEILKILKDRKNSYINNDKKEIEFYYNFYTTNSVDMIEYKELIKNCIDNNKNIIIQSA